MTDAVAQRVRQFRFELYSRAWEAQHSGTAGSGIDHLYVTADGCRRAAEAIELAEFHVAFRIPKRGVEHFVRQLGRCSDCTRTRCVGEG